MEGEAQGEVIHSPLKVSKVEVVTPTVKKQMSPDPADVSTLYARGHSYMRLHFEPLLLSELPIMTEPGPLKPYIQAYVVQDGMRYEISSAEFSYIAESM